MTQDFLAVAELELALLALVSGTGDTAEGRALCATLMERAEQIAATAPASALGSVSPVDRTKVRFAAARRLDGICRACASCPRGQSQIAPVIEDLDLAVGGRRG